MRLSACACLLVLSESLISAQSTSPVARAAPLPQFPAPKEAFLFRGNVSGEKEQPKLADLLDEYSRATGQSWLIGKDLRQLLEQTSVGLLQDVSVPPTQAQAWVESLLLYHGFQISIEQSSGPLLISVRSSAVPRVPNTGPSFLQVREHDAGWVAEHPALFVEVAVAMPHVDVRQLANSLRTVQGGDPLGLSVINLGMENTLLVRGTGGAVASLVRTLRELEGRAAQVPPKPSPQPGAEVGKAEKTSG